MRRRKFLQQSAGMGGMMLSPVLAHGVKNNNRKNTTMSGKRMSSFDVPHKGIRNGLSQLSLLAGKTDYNDPKDVEALFKLGKEVFEILTTHANDENDVSLKALEERLKGASHHDVEEHIRIHVAQTRLEDMLQEIHETAGEGNDLVAKGQEFYNLLAKFHADYLNHMAEEEAETQVLLWQHFTDEELAGHRSEIMKKLKPETLLLWFRFIVPAQSHQERTGLLTGFKSMAPRDFFEKAMAVIKVALPAREWEKLNAALQ
jgi:hypothetical protein